jgi:[acyl-carrier-protein] S-malonyltransferase
MDLAKAAGAKRVVQLQVSAPFHCALMKAAQDRLKVDLDAATFQDLQVPLINNWQAKEVHTGAEAREGLFQQVPNPVRWTDSVRYLGEQGVDRFIEVGPGTVLAGLVRTILPGSTCEPGPS